MILPVALLASAKNLAIRIPNTQPYAAERNASWLAIGRAYLKLNDFDAAFGAFNVLTEHRAQAQFRIAAAQWAGDHPESDARHLLHDTINHIESWEDVMSRWDVANLVNPVFGVFGTQAVLAMSSNLKDPFTGSSVLVGLAGLLNDPSTRRDALRSAEELAKRVGSGDRDYALRRVVGGYARAGLDEDARRVRGLMSRDLDRMNEKEATMLRDAERVLQPLVQPDPDSPRLRLRRFLKYGFNDLRVFFLTECSDAGGLDDAEAEQLVNDAEFRRIAPARPPSIYTDPSHFDLDTLATSLFGRPVRERDSDRELIDGKGYLEISDLGCFVRTLRDLFMRFGEIASGFPPEQVDQGLWYVIGEPYWLASQLQDGQIPSEEVDSLVQSMYQPFSDYFSQMADRYTGSAFFMWWDSAFAGDTALDVLRKILVLPHKECRDAALHGLNHLYPDPRAAAIIDDYLEENRSTMTEEEIDFAEACKAGKTQ